MSKIRYRFLPSFDRSIKNLDHQRKNSVVEAVKDLINALDTGVKPEGIGLKKIHHPIWESRAGIKDRILFVYRNDTVIFLIAGTHNEISNFIKHNK